MYKPVYILKDLNVYAKPQSATKRSYEIHESSRGRLDIALLYVNQ